MSEMKMSDIFALPMTQGITCVMSKDHRHEIVFDESDSNVSDQIEHVAHAINNHDRMAEEVAELQAALELMVLHFESNHNSEHECEVIKLSKKILPNLNQEGEE